MKFFSIKMSSWINIPIILPDATLLMLEKVMYLATLLLLVQ